MESRLDDYTSTASRLTSQFLDISVAVAALH